MIGYPEASKFRRPPSLVFAEADERQARGRHRRSEAISKSPPRSLTKSTSRSDRILERRPSLSRSGVGADALDHRPHPIGPLRRKMLLKTQFAEERLGVGRQDFANGAVRIEGKRDGDKAAHQVRVAVAPIMEHLFPGRIRAIAKLKPHLADAAADFIRTVVGGLAQGLERPTQFENIPIAILPVVEEGEVAADGVNACQR